MTAREFFCRVIKDALRNAWEGFQLLPTIGSALLAGVGLLNRPLGDKLQGRWEGVSPWYGAAVLLAFVVYRLVWSAYRVADRSEAELLALRDLRQRKIKIGALLGAGESLEQEKITSDQELKDWLSRLEAWGNTVQGFLGEFWPEKVPFFMSVDKIGYCRTGSFNELHGSNAVKLSKHCANLKELLRD